MRKLGKRTAADWLIKKQEHDLEAVLDMLGDALKSKGITLEELISSGRDLRQEIYNQKYAQGQKG